MRYFYHHLLHQLYISLDDHLSSGLGTQKSPRPLVWRIAPIQGDTTNECGWVHLSEEQFQGDLCEIALEDAARIDPALVAFAVDVLVARNQTNIHAPTYRPLPLCHWHHRSMSCWRRGRERRGRRSTPMQSR